MSHMWLLARMRQPTRPLYADLKETTFSKFLDEVLGEKKILLEREVVGSKLIVPDWNHCSGYELQLRKEALRLVREAKYSIEKALWTAYNNQHHRIEHWLTLLTIANAGGASTSTKTSSSSTTSNSSDQRLQRIEKNSPSLNERCKGPAQSPSGTPKSTGTSSATHSRWRTRKEKERKG